MRILTNGYNFLTTKTINKCAFYKYYKISGFFNEYCQFFDYIIVFMDLIINVTLIAIYLLMTKKKFLYVCEEKYFNIS